MSVYAGIVSQKNRILNAVVICDLYKNRFEPLCQFTPTCLLPLNNVPLLHLTLSTLINDGFKNIILMTCAHSCVVQKFIEDTRYQERTSGLQISVHNTENCRNFGDLMRDLDSSQVFRGISDFLLILADLICDIPLSTYVKKHQERRSRSPNSVITLLLPPTTPYLSQAQISEYKITTVSSHGDENRLIKIFRDIEKENNVILLSDLQSDQITKVHTNLMDVGVFVCSNHIPALFQDNFDYLTMFDLLEGVLTNEDVMGYKIHIEPLPDGPLILPAAPDLDSLMNIGPFLLSRGVGNSLIQPPLFLDTFYFGSHIVAIGPQIFVSSSAKIHPNSRLIGACLIPSGCIISENSCLINCVLGSDCFVGEKARLRHLIASDNVYIGAGVRANTVWLCSRVRILSGFHLPPRCFVGPGTSMPITLGPGRGNLSHNCVILSPKQGSEILDPAVGGEQVWATLYDGYKKQLDSVEIEDIGSSSMDHSLSPQQCICPLWQTAWDRIKGAAKARRNEFAHSQSRTRDSRSSKSSRFHNLMGKVTESDADSDADLQGTTANWDSGDDGEQSDAFLITELKHTLERGERNSHPTENTILEINSLKHAYNIPIEDLYFLLFKALIKLSLDHTECSLSTANSTNGLVTNFRHFLERFHCVLSSYTKGSNLAERSFLQAVEDTACYDETIFRACPFILHNMFDMNLITEETIWWWRDHSPLLADEEIGEKTTLLRTKLKCFFNWLQEPDEEEESGSE